MTLQVIGLFCEDVREEKSGQFTLVGILPDNVTVPPPPADSQRAVIPKLGLYVRVHLDPNVGSEPMAVKLVLPDLSEVELGKIGADIIETSKRQAIENKLPIAGILHHALLQGFAIPGAGKVLAVIDVASERHICAVLNFVIDEQKP